MTGYWGELYLEVINILWWANKDQTAHNVARFSKFSLYHHKHIKQKSKYFFKEDTVFHKLYVKKCI